MAKKPKSSLGVVFWIALLVFLGLLYVANRINFQTVVGKSGIPETVRNLFGGDYRGAPPGPAVPPEPVDPAAGGDRATPPPKNEPPPPSRREETAPLPPQPKSEPPQTQTPRPTTAPVPTQAPPAPASSPAPATKPAEEPPKTREVKLYFVKLTEEGNITLVPITRRVPAGTGPLNDALQGLFEGPGREEKQKGFLSLIPPGARLLSVTLKDGIAYTSFNENFRFNSYGREGLREQLRQIIYTATEFPAVLAVQILINGNRVDYLSPEGVYVGKPLSRESL